LEGRSSLSQKIPNHIAIVMDGNGRWAERQGLSRVEGHRAGVDSVKTIVQCCIRHQVPILSLFAFSMENWGRPSVEVENIMQLFLQALERELQELHENGVRLRFVGAKQMLSEALRIRMHAAEDLTRNNASLMLNIVMNYSGKWDIVQATRMLANQVRTGVLSTEDIDEQTFATALSTHGIDDPDFLIRTSGELRLSNFFLWQFAYTELYFTDILWPDFDEKAFVEALASFAARDRRYGKLNEQEHLTC
jgi:undecaprenyl diphosphate synthase